MIVTFTGYGSMPTNHALLTQLKNAILDVINPKEKTIFYCGGYGDFDKICAGVCRDLKKSCPFIEIVYVTPYLTQKQPDRINSYMNLRLYDSSVYPPLENVPPRFAVCKRNEWMVNEADIVIAYVLHSYGGEYQTLQYAKRKKKKIINLADE